MDHVRYRSQILEHPENRIADFLFGVKAEAQFLQMSVKIDPEEIADSLQYPDCVAHQEHRYRDRDRADYRRLDTHAPQNRPWRRVGRQQQHPRLALGQRACVADRIERNPNHIECEQSKRQGWDHHQEKIKQMFSIRPDERPCPDEEPENIARAQARGFRKIGLRRASPESWIAGGRILFRGYQLLVVEEGAAPAAARMLSSSTPLEVQATLFSRS